MKLADLARIYTDLVSADDKIPDSEYRAKDVVCALRTKYHNLLMEQMETEGIEFIDRFDAARIAFDIVNGEGISPRIQK